MKRYYDVKQCSSIEDLEKMGMSRATVYRKAKQLGIPGKRKSKLDQYMDCSEDELKDLVKKGVINRMDKSRINARKRKVSKL